MIAAVIFPEDMPDWACELAEVMENLCRKELTPKERDAHTTMLAGLLKQHSNVVEGPKARGQAQKNNRAKTGPESFGSSSPTITRKIATDLGISDDTVRNRVRNAVKLAARTGITVVKPTAEAMSGDQLVKIGEAALKAAEADKVKAKQTGKSPRHVNPHEPAKTTVATVRLDVTDPAPFIAWCRARIAGKHKPMSIDILKSYATALAALIAEIKAAS